MKVKTQVKAGQITLNHNQTLVRDHTQTTSLCYDSAPSGTALLPDNTPRAKLPKSLPISHYQGKKTRESIVRR